MDDNELIRRARAGEMVASGAYQMQALCARLATMEAAVAAADRLVYGSDITPTAKQRYIGSIEQDCKTLDAAVELLEEA